MTCNHCDGELVKHDELDEAKAGMKHCDTCGCCFLSDGKTLRPGHTPCKTLSERELVEYEQRLKDEADEVENAEEAAEEKIARTAAKAKEKAAANRAKVRAEKAAANRAKVRAEKAAAKEEEPEAAFTTDLPAEEYKGGNEVTGFEVVASEEAPEPRNWRS